MTDKPGFTVNVDVTNPGQFFACCGLLELAHRLWPGAEGWFEDGQFFISTPESKGTVQHLLQQLANAKASPLTGSNDPKLPPVHLGSPFDLRIDWWLDERGEKTVFGKMFSGQKRTLNDVTRLQDALARELKKEQGGSSIFDWAAPLKGRFGVDPRTAWEALKVGFSPNEQGMEVATYLAVELLGAVGLQTSPPNTDDPGYIFSTWSLPLPACVGRVAAAGLIPTVLDNQFRFELTKRGSYKGFDYATPIGGLR
jgi:CRISPR-associated protein Csx14